MNIKKIKKWIYTHQVEALVILVSILALIIGCITVGPIAALIVVILDIFIFFGPTLYNKISGNSKGSESMSTKKKTSSNNSKKKSTANASKNSNKKTIKTNDSKTKTKEKSIKKKKKKKWLKIILMFFFICFIIGLLACCAFFAYIAANAPKFDPDQLYSSEATIIYDKDNNVYAKLGTEKREKITYDELPEVFVDALVATEDSRFFQHNGFDLPRFVKAAIGQVLGSSGAGGASTLTMQVSKNAFTSNEDEGIEGIIRKFTDIYMSIFQIEKNYTKTEIIEFYINNNCLGGSVYGVEQASLAYFGKSAIHMNLSEAALIAGMFQAPNTYNPLVNPENAAYRRGIVLKLMVRHGYITQEEADAANAIAIEDLVKNATGTSDDTDYQGFVDTVVAEVKKDTGFNPYTTAMEIYTTMDRTRQDAINKIMSGETYNWENDVVQAGITVLETKTGAIAAVGTNRDDSASGLLNHATFDNQNKRQIGSTAKPLFDYGPAIEYNNAYPGMLVDDSPYQYSDGNSIQNFDGGYRGTITYRAALAGSRNIPALKVFQSVKKTSIIEFVTNLGLSPELSGNSLHEAHAIGGYNGESPLTIAAAYAAFGNGGVYNEPYSYTKLIYRDSNEEFENPSVKVNKQAMSEATAFIIQDMLVTTASSALLRYSNVNGWKFSAKTGTSNFSAETKKANNLAADAINDLWVASFTDEYAIAVWYGYDKIYSNHYSHFGNMQHAALFNTVAKSVWTRSTNIEMPDSVVSVTYETQTVAPMLPSEYTPDSLKATEYFKKGSEPTEVSTRFSQLSNVTGLTTTDNKDASLTLSWTAVKSNWLDITYLNNYYKSISTGYAYSIMDWNNNVLGNLGYDIYYEDDGVYTKVGSTTETSFTVEDADNGTYMVRTAYTNYKANQSNGVTINARASGTSNKCVISISNTAAKITVSELSTFDISKYYSRLSGNCSSTKALVNGTSVGNISDVNSYMRGLNKAGTYKIQLGTEGFTLTVE